MFTLTDKLLFISALLSLVYSEVLFFNNQILQAIFIGIWVPSILGFGIYLKLLGKKNNEWIHTILCNIDYFSFLCGFELCSIWWLEFQKGLKVIDSYYEISSLVVLNADIIVSVIYREILIMNILHWCEGKWNPQVSKCGAKEYIRASASNIQRDAIRNWMSDSYFWCNAIRLPSLSLNSATWPSSPLEVLG